MWYLLALGGLFVAIALFYTIKVGKDVETQKDEYDTEFKATKKHPALFNPVFLAYIIGFGGIILLILYFALTWK
ncbi:MULTISPECIES: hypothetical protein [Virgibacillus]|uniref:Short-chain dehydrogenase n=2 Tax=Virgibacillus TaxID=84406 RepID=A0A2K9J0L9_9BACI|nr:MULTISPECIES: hypothetical protein [Virgibacillus]AUJ25235.1 hypothetical protein A21D_02171 [Virgibacillus dokdonensis]NWO14821.1 hypothetical protein [Virgibacillus sp.]SHH90170.1 hypothetical protein SAMN05421807_11837 [Virgibacillus chiguensis]